MRIAPRFVRIAENLLEYQEFLSVCSQRSALGTLFLSTRGGSLPGLAIPLPLILPSLFLFFPPPLCALHAHFDQVRYSILYSSSSSSSSSAAGSSRSASTRACCQSIRTYASEFTAELSREAVARERLAQHHWLRRRSVHKRREGANSADRDQKVTERERSRGLVGVRGPHREHIVLLMELRSELPRTVSP